MEKPDDLDLGKTFTALVRIHEANCQIDYPSETEQNFRIAVMKKLAAQLALTELRPLALVGDGKGVPRPASK